MLASLIDVTLGLVLVLLLRRPSRRVFGAGPAFALWLLPLTLAAVPWLPALHPHWQVMPTLPVHVMSQPSNGAPAASSDIIGWIAAVWAVGAACVLTRLLIAHARLARQCVPLPADMAEATRSLLPATDRARLRLHPNGPAVMWALRSRILLPTDFLHRFDPRQRAIVLAHEAAHVRRGDALWNLLAELACTTLWFHPLAWLALPRFRLDQELACDEHVLRQSTVSQPAYARTLLSSTGVLVTPALTPWFAEPQLKERLTMIRRTQPGALRRNAGHLGLALCGAGLAFVLQAAPRAQAHSAAPATRDLTFNTRAQPAYPKSAILNKEQGVVMLQIAVSPDGTVKAVHYVPEASTTTSASLISSATQAALAWHFHPAMQNGQPIESHARVPVKFDIHPIPDAASGDTVEKKDS